MTAFRVYVLSVLMTTLLTACQSTEPVPTPPNPSPNEPALPNEPSLPTEPEPPTEPSPTTQYTLSVTMAGNGKVTGQGIDCGIASVDCTQDYDAGSSVELTATPVVGYAFDHWRGACSSENTSICTLMMDDEKVVNAMFEVASSANTSR